MNDHRESGGRRRGRAVTTAPENRSEEYESENQVSPIHFSYLAVGVLRFRRMRYQNRALRMFLSGHGAAFEACRA